MIPEILGWSENTDVPWGKLPWKTSNDGEEIMDYVILKLRSIWWTLKEF